MVTIRKIVGWLPRLGGALVVIAAFDWVDYHSTKGVSPIWGRNPRCTDYQFGYCFKLDTSNMPWDATLATWLGQGVWWLTIAFCAVGGVAVLVGAISGVVLLARVALSPREERLSRIADSRWLMFETWGIGMVLVAAIVSALLWADRSFTALLFMLVGGALVFIASFRMETWASDFRHQRSLERRAIIERESANLH